MLWLFWRIGPGNKGLLRTLRFVLDCVADVNELRHYMRSRLPDPMVPSDYLMVDAFPLLPSGKVDRKTLALQTSARPIGERGRVAPQTPTQERLAAMWRTLLQVEEVGITDNFFELGGHSLMVMQVVARIERNLKLRYRSEACSTIQPFRVWRKKWKRPRPRASGRPLLFLLSCRRRTTMSDLSCRLKTCRGKSLRKCCGRCSKRSRSVNRFSFDRQSGATAQHQPNWIILLTYSKGKLRVHVVGVKVCFKHPIPAINILAGFFT